MENLRGGILIRKCEGLEASFQALEKPAPKRNLERPNVLSLPALGAFGDLKFHALAFL